MYGWNDNKPIEEAESSNNTNSTEKCTITIIDSLEKKDSKIDAVYIEFELKEEKGKFHTNVRQYLKKNPDGSYKVPLYSEFEGNDGQTVPASVAWELKELIKEKIGVEAYNQKKVLCGGITKEFFKGCQFDIDVRYVKTAAGEFHFLQLSKQRIEGENFKKQKSEPSTSRATIVDKDLPF